MRKIALYHLLNIFVLLVYVALLLLQYYLNIFSLPLSLIWCPLLLLMEGCMMMTKTILFHSRTSLWFGLVLFLWGANLLLIQYMHFEIIALIPACLISISVVGFVMAIAYRDSLQLGIGITSALVAIPFVFYVMHMLPLWLALLIGGGVLLLCLGASRFIPKK